MPAQSVMTTTLTRTFTVATQLAEWARLGFIRRTGAGTYALNTPPPNWPPDHLADQLTTRSPEAVTAHDNSDTPSLSTSWT